MGFIDIVEIMAEILIRKTSEKDLPAVAKIRDDIYLGRDYLEDMYLEWIRDPDFTGYACEIDGQMVRSLNNLNTIKSDTSNKGKFGHL